MNQTTIPADAPRGERTPVTPWQPLHFLNLYRMVISGLFLALSWTETGPTLLGRDDPRLFIFTSLIYLSLAIVGSFSIRKRWPVFQVQLALQLTVDIACITVLTHASGGVTSGLGMLLVAAVAGGSLLVSRHAAVAIASGAALAILLEESYRYLWQFSEYSYYTHAGILGMVMLITSVLASTLARRALESEALAAQRGIDLANLEQVNDYIIQHMQTGIIVADEFGVIRLINESARKLLESAGAGNGSRVEDISSELSRQLHAWKSDGEFGSDEFRASASGAQILPRFARLGGERRSGALVFLEDTAGMAQRAQQLKLASLGRLTASIAHEIRNPLGAISHASQLLHESPDLGEGDQRLSEIIHEHAQRVNKIIENIMQLSRRDRSNPELFGLLDWLEHFADEFCQAHKCPRGDISIEANPPGPLVRFDRSQLRQVMWNLCGNALRYADAPPGEPKVRLVASQSDAQSPPALDVLNPGAPIGPEAAEQLFEPFYTTHHTGTGLGLYISRELCEANQARLDYVPIGQDGSCFRLSFADPRRKQQKVA